MPSPLASGSLQLPYNDETYVYRVYCLCGDLLYVGMANDLATRMAKHRMESRWMVKANSVEWDLYATRAQAKRAEYTAIRQLGPLHNFVHNIRHPRPKPLPWPRFLSEEEKDWRAICAVRNIPFLTWLRDRWEAAA